MEESGLEEMTNETEEGEDSSALPGKDVFTESDIMFAEDEGVDVHSGITPPGGDHDNLVIRTLDGEVAGDEFAQDAINYQILLGKIDTLLDKLTLDA